MKKSLALIFLFFFAFNTVSAQTDKGEGIKISPVKFEKTVSPGESITQTLLVTNEAPGIRKMQFFVKDFRAKGEEGAPEMLDPGSEDGYFLSSWIKPEATDFEFQPGETRAINFSVNVPSNIGPGGYYGAVIMGTVPDDATIQSEDKGAAVETSHQTAALLLFRVAGEVDEDAMIKDFKPEKRLYGTPYQTKFMTRIENLGNVHIKPVGMIEIYDMFGEKKVSLRINDRLANILPKSVRRFDSDWAGKWGFGKYKANLILSYGTSAAEGGEGKKTLDSIAFFWIVPWKILIPSLIGLISLIALIFATSRFYKNKAVRKVIEELGAGQALSLKETAVQSNKLPIGLITAFFISLVFLCGVIIYFIFFA
jgi:hypothetical protein